MKGYILRWNPTFSSWKMETHKEIFQKTSKGETLCSNWSIYDFEDLEQGDFFILQQVGTENDGIAALGIFTSETYTDENWRRKDGTNLFYADIEFDCVLQRDKSNIIFSADDLTKKFPQIDWHKGHSGVVIPKKIQEELVLEIVTVLFNQKKSTEEIAFSDETYLWSFACELITNYCPNFKSQLFEQSKVKLKNYKEGEVIDKNLISVNYMYDKIMNSKTITRENLTEYLYPEV